jgi:ABC-2 type transport system permease protein
VNRQAVWSITVKDLSTVLRNRGIRTPLLLTPALLLLVMPTLLIMTGDLGIGSAVPIDDIAGTPLERVADPDLQARAVGSFPPGAQWAVFVLEIFVAPLFLLVPLLVATVIAADSFAGERERGTLEALLHTPTTDSELLAGKFLAAWLPAVAISLTSFAVYSVLANALAWPYLGAVFFPSPTWLLLAFWVTPALSAFGLSVMVIASSRVQSLQAAHQIGSLLVLPIVILLIVQITGVFLFSPLLVTLLGVGLWALSGAILLVGGGALRREALALRL